eukprot:467719_1
MGNEQTKEIYNEEATIFKHAAVITEKHLRSKKKISTEQSAITQDEIVMLKQGQKAAMKLSHDPTNKHAKFDERIAEHFLYAKFQYDDFRKSAEKIGEDKAKSELMKRVKQHKKQIKAEEKVIAEWSKQQKVSIKKSKSPGSKYTVSSVEDTKNIQTFQDLQFYFGSKIKDFSMEIFRDRDKIPPYRQNVGILMMTDKQLETSYTHCTGELIDATGIKYIMTAAHCGAKVKFNTKTKNFEIQYISGATVVYWCPGFHNLEENHDLVFDWMQDGRCIKATHIYFPNQWLHWYKQYSHSLTLNEKQLLVKYHNAKSQEKKQITKNIEGAILKPATKYPNIKKMWESKPWQFDFALFQLEREVKELSGFKIEVLKGNIDHEQFNKFVTPFYPAYGEEFNVELIGYPYVDPTNTNFKLCHYYSPISGHQLLATQYLNHEQHKKRSLYDEEMLYLYIPTHDGASGGALLINDRFVGVLLFSAHIMILIINCSVHLDYLIKKYKNLLIILQKGSYNIR